VKAKKPEPAVEPVWKTLLRASFKKEAFQARQGKSGRAPSTARSNGSCQSVKRPKPAGGRGSRLFSAAAPTRSPNAFKQLEQRIEALEVQLDELKTIVMLVAKTEVEE